MTQPVLSIGIPVYNGGAFLNELLLNLKRQTFEDFEIIICDNASTDGTR
jgi:glycosyltransferase involved in cell wall biosynthesis